jgi:hypothetical protein
MQWFELLPVDAVEVWRRDAYGFAVRPQHLQRFREYAKIYKVSCWKYPLFCLYVQAKVLIFVLGWLIGGGR